MRTELEFHDFAGGPFASFDVVRRSTGVSGPQPPPLPAAIRVVDTSVKAFGVEAHGIGNPQRDELPVRQALKRVRHVSRSKGNVPAEAECVELIDPSLVARLHRAWLVL